MEEIIDKELLAVTSSIVVGVGYLFRSWLSKLNPFSKKPEESHDCFRKEDLARFAADIGNIKQILATYGTNTESLREAYNHDFTRLQQRFEELRKESARTEDLTAIREDLSTIRKSMVRMEDRHEKTASELYKIARESGNLLAEVRGRLQMGN